MKSKITILAIAFLMASILLSSCSTGKGDLKDRNLEQATLSRLDSIPNYYCPLNYTSVSPTS